MSSSRPTPQGIMDDNPDIPLEVDEVDTEWFQEIFDFKVKEAKVVRDIPGPTSKLFVEIAYDEEYDEKLAPKKVVVKGCFDPDFRALFADIRSRREAAFFYYLAPKLDMRLPSVWYATSDFESGQGILVMSDLTAENCTFTDCKDAWSVDQVKSALEQLAILHAKTWGSTKEDYPWIKEEEFSIPPLFESLFAPREWSKHITNSTLPLHESLTDRDRVVNAFRILWRSENPKLRAVVHGDCRVDNTYILPNGDVAFLDFQTVFFGSAFHDVAFFVSSSLRIADRRVHEREVVSHYLDALHAQGGPQLTLDEVWDDYRKHLLHGFAWALSLPFEHATEKIQTMTKRHSAAIVDNGTLELLESLQ